MRMCGIDIMIALLGAALFAGGVVSLADAARASDPVIERKYSIATVFSADFCGPRKDLEAWLRRHGYPVKVTEVTTQPAVAAFPTVFYVGPDARMSSDNGQKVYNWETRLPEQNKPVQIILWRTK